MGMGSAPRTVRDSSGGRFQHAPDGIGILGHRLVWAARGLALWHRVWNRIAVGQDAARLMDTLWRVGHRAAAYLREEPRRAQVAEMAGPSETLNRALRHMASWSRTRRRNQPLVARYSVGGAATRNGIDALINTLTDEVDEAIGIVSQHRLRAETKLVREWCRSASMRLAHRATKPPDVPMGYSASADKKHRGERTPQIAADKGIEEWGAVWKATEEQEADDGDAILKLMNDVYNARADDDETEITLPPIDADVITLSTASFRADTGIGIDWLPPRLVNRLSKGAKTRLAMILTGIEKRGRWPSCVRAVVEIARAKKAGGGGGRGLYACPPPITQ